jgi:hypothetical protein
MTREDVIRMARESDLGFVCGPLDTLLDHEWENLHRFAGYVASVEREACAKACEDVHAGKYDAPEFWREGVAYTCAAAIRARSKA